MRKWRIVVWNNRRDIVHERFDPIDLYRCDQSHPVIFTAYVPLGPESDKKHRVQTEELLNKEGGSGPLLLIVNISLKRN